MQGMDDLVAGFRRFQSAYYGERRELVENLVRPGEDAEGDGSAVADAACRADPIDYLSQR
jgi:hypothetical protein